MNTYMKTTNILIVEDELLIAENLAMKLEKFEYNVLDIVSSGKSAIKKVNAQTPDLILMDIAIKGDIDGITTAAKIRENHNVPIIFLTAYADEKTLERASKTGCYGYILKPFKDRELHAAIKMAINKHKEQNQIQETLETKIQQYAARNGAANIDPVTQLPNHLSLRDLFEYISSECRNGTNNVQSKDSKELNANSKVEDSLAVICLEIDRFKRVYQSLNNSDQDFLMISIAKSITNSLASFDTAKAIIKLQNSEFVVLISGINQKAAAQEIADNILKECRKPFIANNSELFLTASIGVALYPSAGSNIEQLLNKAEQAMHFAEQKGGDQFKFYSNSLKLINSSPSKNLQIETELHYALEREELELLYQPKIELKTGKIIGAEALIRWNHPRMGLVMPNQFIGIAEQSSLIESIGEWVLSTACKQAQHWHKSGFDDFNIAVNLSGRQFKQLDLFHKLTQILYDSGLKPQFLELELTEQILVENEKMNIQRLNLIKKLDLKISLDDFGTGYSSLGYLQQFPFDVLKIDRCFITDIEQKSKKAIIVKSVIEMAHKLDLKVVAEGVETKSELAFLVENKCDLVQGYFFSRPISSNDFEQLLFSKRPFDIGKTELLTTAEV